MRHCFEMFRGTSFSSFKKKKKETGLGNPSTKHCGSRPQGKLEPSNVRGSPLACGEREREKEKENRHTHTREKGKKENKQEREKTEKIPKERKRTSENTKEHRYLNGRTRTRTGSAFCCWNMIGLGAVQSSLKQQLNLHEINSQATL